MSKLTRKQAINNFCKEWPPAKKRTVSASTCPNLLTTCTAVSWVIKPLPQQKAEVKDEQD